MKKGNKSLLISLGVILLIILLWGFIGPIIKLTLAIVASYFLIKFLKKTSSKK